MSYTAFALFYVGCVMTCSFLSTSALRRVLFGRCVMEAPLYTYMHKFRLGIMITNATSYYLTLYASVHFKGQFTKPCSSMFGSFISMERHRSNLGNFCI
jgi:hypothetical protein